MTSPVVPAYGPATYGEREALPLDRFNAYLDRALAGVDVSGPATLQQLATLTPDQLQAATLAARH
jgi:hypothetical protein